jgi:hypothetical protein
LAPHVSERVSALVHLNVAVSGNVAHARLIPARASKTLPRALRISSKFLMLLGAPRATGDHCGVLRVVS